MLKCPFSQENKAKPIQYIKYWPVNGAAEDELTNIKETHDVVPILAYSMAGELLTPYSYCACLKGALVEVRFNLVHWSIALRKTNTASGRTEGADTYGADINRLWIILPGAATASLTSLRKRKVLESIDIDVSPTKKRS